MSADASDDDTIVDRVPDDAPGAAEIGFSVPDRYNASEILFRNLETGRGDKIAIYGATGDWTYRQLCEQAARFGNGFRELGLARGDRVLLFLDDTPVYPAALFGAIRAGLVPVLINTLSPVELVRFYLQDSRARAAIVDAAYADSFDGETVDGTALETVIVNGLASLAGRFEIKDAETWLAGQETRLDAARTDRDDMAFWMYSSGSTGRPKGVVHLQHDMLYTAQSYARHVIALGQDDISFSVPKIFFAYGFGNSVTFPFATGGGSVLLAGRPDPQAVFTAIERFRPTVFYGLPTLFTALLKDPRSATADLSSLRLCVSAAEVLSAEIFNGWKELFGLEIVEGLGSTELLHMYLSNTVEQKKLGAAGKRVPGYEIRLTDRAGAPVAAGEEGILSVRGHSSAPCYWGQSEKTADTMRDDWIWTGDRFVEDEDGFYFFRGRADDLIKVSGQWVYPLEIELCLAEHPAVRECAVFGVELADRRMTIRAFVVLEPGRAESAATTKELQAYVKAALLPYKYPRIIDYTNELPKTGTGKIDRQALKARPLES
ncbi:MAG: benzoate-CoA ligase family protein [Alphaproteobacteria bacterium]|nr:benzoate-CoA ligase family protein [Alphaproteobacteria bacterium]